MHKIIKILKQKKTLQLNRKVYWLQYDSNNALISSKPFFSKLDVRIILLEELQPKTDFAEDEIETEGDNHE